ncbi:TlpA family protein disulfide reductase [Elizabethkingia anophelis]|uniref:TlpA family protein disulfide reductase n=2 Tax=Elizabethkingia anophelis TaxID=1117645 RepID=UPI00084069DE|nr:TlpA disulfide reductase family protein [Elizabethkingia anophelis]MCT3663571.1 TlpA family protein disulfide reductase [Elizabethkingia anophelis]MCT3802211.1 TlpA family protein disulfide reductase [Elizabethkingia anophelis]MCT3905601.1 TlpA family protein disulfide reductase [Elizabethkingia anophelis]MCT4059124.1 TlpA family protein disulfide reductase [Elizabethkingia anophelis]MCT4069636.1 TlpA family protein disulfide reductase [Elizabethkingia anophelis]
MMDMVINKFGKNIFSILLIIFVVINIACQKNNKEKTSVENAMGLQKENDSIHATINVEFIDTGVFALNTLINQKSFSINIPSSKSIKKKSKQLSLVKPSVFESYRLVKNKTVVKRYFVFKEDTLSFKFCRDCINSYSGNAKNNILNILINDNNVFAVQTPNNIINYIEEQRKNYEKNVREVQKMANTYNNAEQGFIIDYLTLYFYNKIFNIDFSKVNDPKTIEQLDFYYKEIFDNIKLLDKLNTILNKNVLYNLLRFTSFKNKNPDLLECLHFLDSKLYQTEALDGFLLDYMESFYNNLSDKDLITIKKYIRKRSLKNVFDRKTKKISENVFSSKLQDVDSNEALFQEVLLVKATESLVLIDLWATWCVPCLNEMPAWNKSEQKYKGKIKFVKISIDNNFEKWYNFLSSKNDHNFNYIITNSNHPFIKEFKISTIPRYMLLNKNHEIISDDFTRPSDSRFSEQIEKYLQ